VSTDPSEAPGPGVGTPPITPSARASQILKVKKIWLVPLLLASVLIALITVIYVGSVINPTGHLHDLPVVVVNEDRGADAAGQRLDFGAEIVKGLRGAAPVTSRLDLEVMTLAQAHAEMDRADAYATLVIPPTLSRSLLLDTGAPETAAVPARATLTLQENLRLGSLGVSIASGVLAPAVQKISTQVSAKLTPKASKAAISNPVVAAQLADPVALATASYRPLPDHTALGLSAFYAALLAIMAGFLGGTLINSSIDAALGYASTELGPRWSYRRPVKINRVQTLLIKWATALIAAPVLTGILMLIATAGLGMRAPDWLLLWGLLALGALMIATGTLALLAAFGTIGQLLAIVLLVYLSLASSGGTVPIQALPSVFKLVGHVEPLRQILTGVRAILYFDARGDAGLTHSLVVVVCELVFWAILGVGFAAWYDRRGLDRISPDLLNYIARSVQQRQAQLDATATRES
jgi:YhgE/Pip-like protein